jgi:hypothetical protein
MRPTRLHHATRVIDCTIQNHADFFCLERSLINRVRPPTALIWWNARQIHNALLRGRHGPVRGPFGRIDNGVVVPVMRVTWGEIRSAVGYGIVACRVSWLLISIEPVPRCIQNRVVYIVKAGAFVKVIPYL